MRFVVLASGSSGNVSAVWNGRRGLLIDAGTGSSKSIEAALRSSGLDPQGIAGILVTHAHSDHFGQPARIFAKKYGVPVLTHRETYAAACRRARNFHGMDERGHVKFLKEDAPHLHDDFQIHTWSIPHGAESAGRPLAFSIACNGRSLFYATDLGTVPPYLIEAMRAADFVVLESNYDIEMEVSSGRPDHLIAWVTGPTGHLSNDQAAEALKRVFEPGHAKYPKRVVLAHLSEECNHPDKALAASRPHLPLHVELHIAPRHEATAVWEV